MLTAPSVLLPSLTGTLVLLFQFLPLDGEGGRRSLPDEVTKAKGFCFTNTPHPMATPSALPAVGEGNSNIKPVKGREYNRAASPTQVDL